MKKSAIYPKLYAVFFLTSVLASTARSQTVLNGPHRITGSLEVQDGGIFTGTIGYGFYAPSGAGTRMLWYPRKAAFRAGNVSSSQWDDMNVGINSVALGLSTIASGDTSTALGYSTLASGNWGATALGVSTQATGIYGATAMGWMAKATNSAATAMGMGTTASGGISTALGSYTQATGGTATAMGAYTIASGGMSTAMGYYTTAKAYGSTVLGRYNLGSVSTGGATAWVDTDPVFEIGNGKPASQATGYQIIYSNAFTVYKNGNVTITGTVSMPRQGDISMGDFGN